MSTAENLWGFIFYAVFFLTLGFVNGFIFRAFVVEKKPIAQVKTVANITPSPTITPVPTLVWNTYKSENFKYELRYPSNWIINDVKPENVDIVFEEKDKEFICGALYCSPTISFFTPLMDTGKIAAKPVDWVKSYLVNSKLVPDLIATNQMVFEDSLMENLPAVKLSGLKGKDYLFVFNGRKIYVIVTIDNPIDPSTTLQGIIASFKTVK